MVSPKRLENGFNGYQVPVVPRASRSARGRVPLRKKSECNQIQAFEILASVAGKFLLDDDDTVPTNAADKNDLDCIFDINLKAKQEDGGWLSKEEACEQGSCSENTVACVPWLQGNYENQSYTSNKNFSAQENIGINIDHPASKSWKFSENLCLTGTPRRSVGESSCHGYCFEGKGRDFLQIKEADGLQNARRLNEKNTHVKDSPDDIVKLEQKPMRSSSSGSYGNFPFLHERMNLNSFHGSSARKVGSRDNGKTFGVYTSSGATNNTIAQPSDMEDHKITVVSAYENHRETSLKRACSPRTDDNKNGMDSFSYERLQRLYPIKKRKFFKEPLPAPNEEYEYHHEGVSTSDNKVNVGAVGAVEASSFAFQKVCHKSKDCNVKLSIKSFRVPELFIEIPETATIGSLKRTVMEAVSSILGDELHVGILLQGKKVRDDSKTLVQTGIAQDDKKNRLGFMLEPRHAQGYPPSYSGRTSLLSTGPPKQFSRQSASLTLQPGSFSSSKEPRPIKSESAGGDYNVVPLSATSADKTMSKCRALVAVPSINMEALAVIPYIRKSGNPEFAQRRIRRPFSVSEVEALVQAVEKLGTGRWRDVKVCAFDNVKHRTYVDLKDKWKTLVHTARISPQQRRGEPVPQQLLDRVLAAHAYWSQQSRQQIKAL